MRMGMGMGMWMGDGHGDVDGGWAWGCMVEWWRHDTAPLGVGQAER